MKLNKWPQGICHSN